MDYGLLKPLAVFSSQSQSQKYIKTVKNLGDAWRTLAQEPTTELNQNTTVIETTFDFVLEITKEPEPKCDTEQMSIDMRTLN